jgi:hypothetical protein
MTLQGIRPAFVLTSGISQTPREARTCLSPKLHYVEKPAVYEIASGQQGTM